MSYSLKSIERLLKDIEERKQKKEKREHNRKVGYAPKCKVCNSEYLDEIESLREQYYTYEEIIEELGITDISIMSLSRHFKNHYPNSQAYKEKQQIEMLENIKEAYLKYPFLEEYFKDKDLGFLQTFNKGFGFCTDKMVLCEHIPEGTVSNCTETVTQLKIKCFEEIDRQRGNSFFALDRDKKNEIETLHLQYITECLSCKNEINEKRLNLLERIITYNFLNIPPENKELYFNLLQFEGTPDEFIQTLEEVTPEK